MKGYWIILGSEITDPAAQEHYASLWKPIAAHYGATLKPLTNAQLKEPGTARRLFAVEFDSLAKAQACYEDPAYAQAMTHALRAASRQLLIIEGDLA